MTTFNIGSQNAGSIENIGGGMVVNGGINGTASLHVLELRNRLAELQVEVDALDLPPAARAAASGALADAQAEAAAPDPRPSRIGDSLRRVTGALEDGGALATGVGLVRVLTRAVSLVSLLV
jgi:hypothetical protein